MAAEVLASLCALGLQFPIAAGQVSVLCFFPQQLPLNLSLLLNNLTLFLLPFFFIYRILPLQQQAWLLPGLLGLLLSK
jgi:hypothetical protein